MTFDFEKMEVYRLSFEAIDQCVDIKDAHKTYRVNGKTSEQLRMGIGIGT